MKDSTNFQRGMPGAKYGRRVRSWLRQRDADKGVLPQWTGTDEQRARTTTDPTQFCQRPDRFDYFHDRQRGQVFIRPLPTEDDPAPKPLPHRYLKLVDLTKQKPGLVGRLKGRRRTVPA